MTVLRDYAAGLAQPVLGETGGPTGARSARYDEVLAPDGTLRTPWKGLAELAVGLTADDLRRVDEEIARALADDGVTYSRLGDRPGPWRLDPVPLILDAASWTPLEVGLAQRAELLNAILADLYGEQRILREGLVPAAVVLGHSGFARAVARPSVPDPRPLVLAATDLGRDASGEWHVLADRAQAPSGLGYAMANRRVISRVLPELYRESGLHRIEPFFSALRSALLQSATGDLADPRVVVLSPGAQSETAYDQSYIASALGFPLVQGSDLVVRDGWVQMRVFGRLERVDVILRRVDAEWTDPLELRGDSQLGVAGLVEAVRRGRVRIVNGLGAGVLENPALLPSMPALCEALLGEPLRLASVPTWWCGEPEGLAHVLAHADELAVRPIDEPSASILSGSPEEVAATVRAAPHRYVGQERLALSQAPAWSRRHGVGTGHGAGAVPGAAEPHPLTLRTFTLRYGSAYRPLVGGLVSIVGGEDPGDHPGGSKDLWVLKAAPDAPDQGLADVLPMTHVRADTGAGPRILDDMFWFGRYAERAEDMLRLVVVVHGMADDVRGASRIVDGGSLAVLRSAITRLAGERGSVGPNDPGPNDPGPNDPGPSGPGQTDPGALDRELRSVLLDGDRVGSVGHAVVGLRDALAGVRDQLSPDTWRVFGAVDRASHALESNGFSHQVAESAGRMLTGILSLQGVTASMIRDAGWHMLGVGRSLERSLQLCHLLAATTIVRRGIDVDREVHNAVLAAAESAVTHRRRYRGYVRPGGVLELLLMDETNPRSLAFALADVEAHLAALPASTGSSRPERRVADLRGELAETDVAALVAIGGVGRPNLERFLAHMIGRLELLGEAVAEVHLTTGPAPRAFGAFDLVAPSSAGGEAP